MWAEINRQPLPPRESDRLRLWRIFILGRTIATGVFLALVLLFRLVTHSAILQSVFMLALVQFATSGVYLYLWKRHDITFLSYLAFGLEIILITLLIYFFGPDGKVFVLAYLWPIIMAGWLCGRHAVPALTLLSGIGYTSLVLLAQRGLVFSERILLPGGTSLAFVLSLPYLAFLALIVWLLVREMERGEADLTQRNQDLHRVNNLLRGILAHMSEAVVVANREQPVLLANRAARDLLHIEEHQPLPAWFREQLPDALDMSRALPRQIMTYASKTISVSMAELPGAGSSPTNIIYVARDVTEQVKIEQIRSDFVAYASHELRTPLTTIKMLVRMLLMDAQPGTQSHEYLSVVNQQVERQVRLVNNLLDFTRLEAGQYDLPLERIDPRLMVQGAVGNCRPLADAKSIKLGVTCDKVPAWIMSNNIGLDQVLVNLLSNAIKFTAEGGAINVSCRQENGEVLFSVRDSGIGMTPEQMAGLFTKFYTVRNPQKQGEGTGLGLAISDMIVRQLGGHIVVTSEVNVGSCFTVHLPYVTG